MSILNRLSCSTYRKNVGYSNCFFTPDLITGALLFGTKKSFTPEELDALEQTLRDMAVADSKSSRVYPISNFVAATDNTEDETVQTFDYGPKAVVKDGDYDLAFQYIDGGMCLHKALTSHNGPTPFLLVDKQNRIIGTEENGQLTTIAPHFFKAKNWRLATGSTVAAFMIRISFFSRYINEKIAFVEAGFDVNELEGLQDIKIVQNSFDSQTGVAKVTIQTDCGSVNLGDQYQAIIAAHPELLVATNGESGEEISISSAVYNPDKTFDLQLDPEDADYPDDGIGILLKMASVSVLDAAGISGYESNEIELEPDAASSSS